MDPTTRQPTPFSSPARSRAPTITSGENDTGPSTSPNATTARPTSPVVCSSSPHQIQNHNTMLSRDSPMAIDQAADLHSIPDQDEIMQLFLDLKTRYTQTIDFREWGRQEMINNIKARQASAQALETSIQQVAPGIRDQLTILWQQETTALMAQEAELEEHDKGLKEELNIISEKLNSIYNKGEVNRQFYYMTANDLQWPTIDICHDLQLTPANKYVCRLQYEDLITTPATNDQQPLMNMILMQQRQIADLMTQINKKDQSMKAAPATVTSAKDDSTSNKMNNNYQDRRRRHKIPPFKDGTPTEAQQWMEQYERMSRYLGFTSKEKLDELDACMQGSAINWLAGLTNDVRFDWDKVKTSFLYHFGGGSQPSRIALAELKHYYQQDIPMRQFGPKIKELLH
ncbi:hypothetical protein BDC45DRAFT_573913 [Circinella umbellata]|nr:hypothetical protein BDC45DRAFT_573913 [Circinella umbellata]